MLLSGELTALEIIHSMSVSLAAWSSVRAGVKFGLFTVPRAQSQTRDMKQLLRKYLVNE